MRRLLGDLADTAASELSWQIFFRLLMLPLRALAHLINALLNAW